MSNITAISYLISSVLFILALRGLSSPTTSRQGNVYGMIGMLLAVITTFLIPTFKPVYWLIGIAIVAGAIIGSIAAKRVQMTKMPELVALMHSFVGLSAVLIAIAAVINPAQDHSGAQKIELFIGAFIGAITFTASIIAFGKLSGKVSGKPVTFSGQHMLNLILAILMVAAGVVYFLTDSHAAFLAMCAVALVLGVTLIIPIGGADMPVVVSMLNSYSGWAAAAMGFTLHNTAMIITGALVGSSGAILSYIMCKAMNRSFISVIAGGFGAEAAATGGPAKEQRPWKRGSAEDAAYMMQQAESVIIVPGYGMAVAQAQHILREMADVLKKQGVSVKYAIHPVAGRMPGHMNVLLAEAQVPYDEVFELEDINSEFAQTDVAFIIGANDVVNPAAKTDKTSPIYGMPVFDVDKAKTVFFVKRSMGGVGYAGVDNDVFYMDQTMMLLADAKKMCEDIVKALQH